MIQDILPSHLDNQFYRDMEAKNDDPVFVFREDSLLLADQDEAFLLPTVSELPDNTKLQFLFHLDQQPYYLALAGRHYEEKVLTEKQIYEEKRTSEPSAPEHDVFDLDGFSFVRTQSVRSERLGTKKDYFITVTAYQLHRWYLNNRFCGHCGGPTEIADTERALKCPSCGNRIYPKIVPAVIVGVTNGDELLVTRYANLGVGYDALVAGFTEIGETFEQTVAREVMEETGLRVKNIRYYKSQPWGIVDDILAGFYCDVDGDTTIHRDAGELKSALWVKREDIVGQPDDMSLTNEMMIVFREGKEPV